ncbi:MAG: hypothetical protein JWM27_4486 [Gemmatimonadetes bacterium]|nr:hypothetical protein [Gemmatimonadota bacterium]
MPLRLHPGEAREPTARRLSRAYDARVSPYEAGYDVMRGYEAAPRPAEAPEPAAWFGGRARDRG